ncbi:MAG: inositol monophosphatase family protein, partial [Planctomycetota bacterium]
KSTLTNDSTQLEVAKKAALDAAEIIQVYARRGFETETKVVNRTELGLVTKADLDAERSIIEAIQSHFPDHTILSEESHPEAALTEHLWVIDPLDGTNNFAHGIPHYSVSIAYSQHGIVQCGVVINPATGEMFWAEQGKGAWLGELPIQVSVEETLQQSMLATGFYYDRGQMMRETLATIETLFENNIRGIRRFGSAALDLCFVASGRFTGFFEYTLFPWDFAAGLLIAEEAGGKVSDCAGHPIQLQRTSMLATNEKIHQVLLNVTQKYFSD